MKSIKLFFKLLKNAGSSFLNDSAFKLSASLSYYTIFALGPLLIMIISLAGIFFGRDAVQGDIFPRIKNIVGTAAASQIEDIIRNIHKSHSSTTGAIIGTVILIIAATGIFTEMQSSINFIWSVKAKPQKGWLKYLINRLISFLLILTMGFLLLVSLISTALLKILSARLVRYKFISTYTVYLFHLINLAVIIIIITALFTIVFKLLPDAIISWKDALIGGVFTSLLFLLGELIISYYLSLANLDITFGTAASIVVILSWVYYTSLILYFGTEFTKAYALQAGEGIRPKETAVFIIKREAKEITASHLET